MPWETVTDVHKKVPQEAESRDYKLGSPFMRSRKEVRTSDTIFNRHSKHEKSKKSDKIRKFIHFFSIIKIRAI
jgi:hypothetical protein